MRSPSASSPRLMAPANGSKAAFRAASPSSSSKKISRPGRARGMSQPALRREPPTTHGTGTRLEGCFQSGFPVVIVEDVLTTGASARDAISAVEAEGGHVLGVMAVVDRQEGGRQAIEASGYVVEAFLSAADLGLGAA